jgi:O-antigen biosynthesis protein WbqP
MSYQHYKRAVDLFLSLIASILLLMPILLTAIAVALTSRGPIIYWSKRVGAHNVLFDMPKFRSMRVDTPAVATHLLNDPQQWLTPVGAFLRKTSLDELPQLWSVICGHMSLVGPRPALFNQDDLIEQRTQFSVHKLLPGVTGWAQVNGRDELVIAEKVKYDAEYMHKMSIYFDAKIIWMTIRKVISRDGVSH